MRNNLDDKTQTLIDQAKRCTRQEILQEYSDPSHNYWWTADRMPNPEYWTDVEHYLPRDLLVEEDSQGAILVVRITRKGTPLGRLGKRDLYAREEMRDTRRFSVPRTGDS